MDRIYRQTGVQLIAQMLKSAEDAVNPVNAVFDNGILANAVQGAERFGIDPTRAQDEYIQRLRAVYDKYMAPFHRGGGDDGGTASENPPKVVTVPK